MPVVRCPACDETTVVPARDLADPGPCEGCGKPLPAKKAKGGLSAATWAIIGVGVACLLFAVVGTAVVVGRDLRSVADEYDATHESVLQTINAGGQKWKLNRTGPAQRADGSSDGTFYKIGADGYVRAVRSGSAAGSNSVEKMDNEVVAFVGRFAFVSDSPALLAEFRRDLGR